MTGGEYNVTLKVTDNDGLTGFTKSTLIVKPLLEILDGVDFSAGREVSSDPQKLASGGTPVEGTVTDGVTRLLFRLSLNKYGAVTFSLQGTGNSAEDGILRSIDGFQQGNSITVNTVEVTEEQYAFAIYQAPENFVRGGYGDDDKKSSERTLPIKAEFSFCSPIEEKLKLVRPPLILVHGLWSSKKAWDSFSTMLRNKIPGLQIYTVDYKKTNSNHFEDNKNVPYSCSGDSIVNAKRDFRSQKVAISQVDIVGHSMGGLLTRIWAGRGKKVYARDDNFEAGDIHKLITLDSPHYGAFLADAGATCLRSPHSMLMDALVSTMEKTGYSLTKGAVEDLMTASEPIENMNSVKIRVSAHTIAGEYTGCSLTYYTEPDGSVKFVIEGIPADYFDIQNILIDEGYGYIIIPEVIHTGSDLVVSVYNQKGGLGTYNSSVFDHHHMAATNQDMATYVVELLNAYTDSNLFNPGFPVKQ